MDTIDMRGKPCPIPVIEAKKALWELQRRGAAPGTVIDLLVDNDTARQNLEKMANGIGAAFSFAASGDGTITVSLAVPADGARSDTNGKSGTGLVAAIGKDTMGSGSGELGRLLLTSFIYSLCELETPPERMLFFNSGVFLTTEGSAAIRDLETLERKGTEILSCGTCLDFYQLKEKLAVGGVTNMYAIAAALSGASKIVTI